MDDFDFKFKNAKVSALKQLYGDLKPEFQDGGRTSYGIGGVSKIPKIIDVVSDVGTGVYKNQDVNTANTSLKKLFQQFKTTQLQNPKRFETVGPKEFYQNFRDYKDSYYGGQVRAAADSLSDVSGSDATRVKVKKLFEKAGEDIGTPKSTATGDAYYNPIYKSENPIGLSDAKVKVKFEDKNYFNNIELPEGISKDKFYTHDQIGDLLKIDSKDFKLLLNDLNKKRVTKKKIGNIPTFKLGEAVDVLTTSGLKTIKGGRPEGFKSKRFKLEQSIDPKYVDFFSTFTQRAIKLGKDVDTFIPKAIESRGHAVDLSVSSKYPKLFKNSNADKFSALVYQDPLLNENILQQIGFGTRPEKNFKVLENLVGKKVTPEIQKQLINAKTDFAKYHQETVKAVRNPIKMKKAIIESAEAFARKIVKKDPKKAKEFVQQAKNIDLKYLNSYFKNQDKRIQKLNINIPKVGETFKSENFFADLSTVDEAYIVGQVNRINPKALRMKDLSNEELAVYQQNVTNQYKDYLSSFYRDVKTPRGKRVYSEDDILDLNDAFDFGTGGQLEGSGEKARQSLSDPVQFLRRKKYAEGTQVLQGVGKATKLGKLGKAANVIAKGEAVIAPLFLYGGAAAGLPFTRNINEVTYGLLGKSKNKFLIEQNPDAKLYLNMLQEEEKFNSLLERYNNSSRIDKLMFKDKMAAKTEEWKNKVDAFQALPKEQLAKTANAYDQVTADYENLLKKNRERRFSNYVIPKKELFIDIADYFKNMRVTSENPKLSSSEQAAIEDLGRTGAAGGGIMKMAGKRFGGPPESGPEEGLASLENYVNQY